MDWTPPYEAREDSYLLAKHIKEYAKDKNVLDMGTGSGVFAIEASKYAKNVTAVDINPKAIALAKKNAVGISNIKLNIQFKVSNLFTKIKPNEKFDLITFNPPYLPNAQNDNDKDVALDGGKHGYELLGKFLNKVNNYLTTEGKILVIFSELTKPEKVKEIIANNCLYYKEIDGVHVPFEELYVWEIGKSELLKKLENLRIENITFFTKGKRGYLYKGKYKEMYKCKPEQVDKKIKCKDKKDRDKKKCKYNKCNDKNKYKKVVIKTSNPKSKAFGRIENEIKFLKILEKYDIAPKIIYENENFFVYEYIAGEFILNFIENNPKEKIIIVLKKIFKMMYLLDKLDINKEEMHHPVKHILINKTSKIGKTDKTTKKNNDNIDVKLVDFERASMTNNPKNVTQFCQFLIWKKMNDMLRKKGIKIEMKNVIELAQKYKKRMNNENFQKIIRIIK